MEAWVLEFLLSRSLKGPPPDLIFLQSRVPHPWLCWHLGLDNSLLWGSPEHCSMFSSIFGFYPQDANISTPLLDYQSKDLLTIPNVALGQSLLVEKYRAKSWGPAQGPSALDLKAVLHTNARDFHSNLLLEMCGHKTQIKIV